MSSLSLVFTPSGPTGSGEPDPVADILGTPDTTFEFDSSSLTGLTAIGTPDVADADTSVPGHYFIRDDGGGGTWVGHYKGGLTAPFTVVTKITDRIEALADGRKHGLFVGDSSPSLSGDADVWLVGNSGNQLWLELASTTNITSSNGVNGSPLYLAIRVNSSSDVDYMWSRNGRVWYKIVDSRNPGIGTLASVGLVIASGGTVLSAAFDYLRIWNSAKSFPGALA